MMIRLLLPLLLPLLLLLQASRAFLLPLTSRAVQQPTTTTTTTRRFASTVSTSSSPTTITASSLSSSSPLQQQTRGRLRFEGFSPEEGAAAGDTITVVYDPRAPGLDAPIRLAPQGAEEDGNNNDNGNDDDEDAFGYSSLHDKGDPSFQAPGAGAGAAAAAQAPCLLFGFDGWDGSERPFVTPLFPGEEEGTWAASVHLPNYARVLDCAVSDGDLAFDTNGGAYFHFYLTHVQIPGADGVTINTFRQGPDGALTPTGVLALNDPQELERMIEEELERRRGEDNEDVAMAGLELGLEGEALAPAPLPALVAGDEEEDLAASLLLDDLMLVDNGGPASPSAVSMEGGEQARRLAASGATGVALSPRAAELAGSHQQFRAEANVIGERVGGMSAIVVNDVREAFEAALLSSGGAGAGGGEGGVPVARTYEGPEAAVLDAGQAGAALARLGLEGFDAAGVEGLCERVLGQRVGDGAGVSLEALMRLFQVLDEEDCGISIV